MTSSDEKLDIREALARLEHAKWSDWQAFLHISYIRREDGAVVIPPRCVRQLRRQFKASYEDLPEHEKDYNREHADMVLALLGRYMPQGQQRGGQGDESHS